MSTDSGMDLYRLVTRNRSDRVRLDAEDPASAATAAAATIEVLLAPLGVTVIGSAAASLHEFDPISVAVGSDQRPNGPGVGVDGVGDDGGATVTLINLNIPIDLPAIDHALRRSDHRVVEIRPVATVEPALH